MIHPDNHNDAADKNILRARSLVLKASQILVHVQQELLSDEAGKSRMQKLAHIAFIRGAFRKKKFPALTGKKQLPPKTTRGEEGSGEEGSGANG